MARAVIMRPSVLLADEPTGNLDTDSGEAIMRLLGAMNRDGLTVLVVTHNADVARHAGRTLRMHDGRFLDGGAP